MVILISGIIKNLTTSVCEIMALEVYQGKRRCLPIRLWVELLYYILNSDRALAGYSVNLQPHAKLSKLLILKDEHQRQMPFVTMCLCWRIAILDAWCIMLLWSRVVQTCGALWLLRNKASWIRLILAMSRLRTMCLIPVHYKSFQTLNVRPMTPVHCILDWLMVACGMGYNWCGSNNYCITWVCWSKRNDDS